MAVCQIMIQDYLSGGKNGRYDELEDGKKYQYYSDEDLKQGIDFYTWLKEDNLKDPIHHIDPDEFIAWAKEQLRKPKLKVAVL